MTQFATTAVGFCGTGAMTIAAQLGIFDSMIAPWFLAGAPSFLKRPHAAMRAAGACRRCVSDGYADAISRFLGSPS